MKKFILFSFLSLFITIGFSQDKGKAKNGNLNNSFINDKQNNETTYVALDGSSYKMASDKILITFEDNLTIEEKFSILSSSSNLKNVEREKIETFYDYSVVETKNIHSSKSLSNLIHELNNTSGVKFARQMYYGSSEQTRMAPLEDVIVRLKSNGDLGILRAKAAEFGAEVIQENVMNHPICYVRASESSNFNSIDLAEKLLATKLFKYAEPNFLWDNIAFNTNDPLVGQQWGLNNDGSNTSTWNGIADSDMNAFEAWAYGTGTGIKVAVVDSGVDVNHEDLDVLPGWDAVLNQPGGDDLAAANGGSHGTSCAGIAAGIGNNGIGIAGVAYNAQIIPIRFLNGNSGTTADAVESILWAIDEGDADVVSNSWGGGGFSQALFDAFEHSSVGRGGLGTLHFVATGNGNGAVSSPANMDTDYIIAVGAMTMCEERKSPSSCDNETFWGSNFGDDIDIVTPSPKIVTTDYSGSGGYTNGNYVTNFNGTSAATPFAAGGASVLLSINPTLDAASLRELIEIHTKKLGTYDYQNHADHPNGTWNIEVGYGMMNLFESAVFANPGPIVVIDSGSLNQKKVEAEGCATFTDYTFDVSILGDYTGTDNPVVTVNIDPASTATQPTDFELLTSNVLTFTGNVAGKQSMTIRVFNDLMADADETILFDLSLEPGNTDVMLSSQSDFTSTKWTLLDSEIGTDDKAAITFISDSDSYTQAVCGRGDLTLSITFDNYPQETSWAIFDDTGMEVMNGGTYDNEADGSTLDIPISLGEGNYTLEFYDSYGDGLTTSGSGFTLIDSEGTTLIDQGPANFRTLTKTFCIASGDFVGGILPVNATIEEVKDCGHTKSSYDIAVNISSCVFGEQDVMLTLIVDSSSTAVEGEDFVFPNGKVVTFNGQDKEDLFIPIDFLADMKLEGEETLVLTYSVDQPDLVNMGEPSMTTITIVDADSPFLTLEPSTTKIFESEYNCGEAGNSMTVFLEVDAICIPQGGVEVTLVQDENSQAIIDEDFVIVGSPTVEINENNFGDEFTFTIDIINDKIIEGVETMMLNLQLGDGSIASLFDLPISVEISDPLAVTPPGTTTVLSEDFESGDIPTGWSIVSFNPDDVVQWTVSENTNLTGMAAHITNDLDTKIYEYEDGLQGTALMSPVIDITTTSTIDFDFEVLGEAGFFGIYDFAILSIIDPEIDITDFAAVVSNMQQNGINYMLFSDGVNNVKDFYGTNIIGDLTDNFEGPQGRIVVYWQNDGSVLRNPPISFDNVEAISGNFIETEVMLINQVPEFNLDAGITNYYYNLDNNKIALSINSTSDHGCTNGFVENSGTGTSKLISSRTEDLIAQKTFAVIPSMPDEEASLITGLYYTEEEISGWEAETGNSRDDLYVFKANDISLTTCYPSNVQLKILFDNFPDETSWDLVNLETGATVASGAGYTVPGDLLIENFNLPEGVYQFTIKDEFNDGICCNYGEGLYSLTAGGEEIVSGGAFRSQESTTFCISNEESEDLCLDYSDIRLSKASLTPYTGGWVVSANFGEGLWSKTSFGITGPPAVTPASFTGKQVAETIELTFKNELPDDSAVDYYIFEKRSIESLDFEEFHTLEQDSGNNGIYTLVDYFPSVGVNEYRVIVVMKDGKTITSCINVLVNYVPTNEFKVTPNPAVNTIQITLSDGQMKGQIDLGIYNDQGKQVYMDSFSSNSGVVRYNVDVSNLAGGLYYINLTDDSNHTKDATFIKVGN